MDVNCNTDVKGDIVDSVSKKDLSIEQKLVNSLAIPDKVDVEIDHSNPSSLDVLEMNSFFSSRRYIYEKVLSPQLEQNEVLKRKHKEILMNKLFKILKWQFIATYLYILFLLTAFSFSNMLDLSDEVVLAIIKFLEFYITSIIVELISILFFIVKNVFDKSIVELISNFDKQFVKKKKRKKKKKKNLTS